MTGPLAASGQLLMDYLIKKKKKQLKLNTLTKIKIKNTKTILKNKS